MKKLAIKALQILGVPASNILRTIEAVRLHAKDIANGEFLSFEAGVDRSPKQHIHRIIEAVDAGNMDLATDLYEVALDEEEMTSLQTALGNKYKNGEVDRDTAETILSEFFELEEDDLYWLFDKWDYAAETGSSEGYAKFDDFLTAVQTGQNLKAVIQQYTDNGVEPQALANQIRDHFKPMYMEMSTTERANIKGYLLNAYEICGVERDKAHRRLGEWEFESKCGIPYSDAKEAFWEGILSAADYKAAIISCEGKTGVEACERIADACKDGYLEGMMSRADAAKLLVSYGGMSSAEAESAMRYYDAKLQYPDLEVQKSWVDKYYSTIKTSGISMDTYLEYRNNCVGVSKKDEKLLLIDRLPISKKQKDALYLAEGWAESKLGEAPWH
jgi:hypothetical protein